MQVRAGAFRPSAAEAAVERLLELPIWSVALRTVAREAFLLALVAGISVYDACYVVLAEAVDAVLVTADRRLAAATERAALLPDARPPSS